MEYEEDSQFLKFFGNTPQFRIIDFLLDRRLEDFTKTQIADGAKISWASLFNYWDGLEQNGIIKVVRKVGNCSLYQINEKSPIVKRLMQIELDLIKNAAENSEQKIQVKQAIRK